MFTLTLSMIWVRKVGEIEELVIATDSRTTSGKAWDSCPKIKVFSRGDSAMCFAGDTDYSYPMMEQVGNAIAAYPKANTRALDFLDLKGHILRVLTKMREYMHNDIEPHKKFTAENPNVKFLLGGYSWKAQSFYINEIFFSEKENSFLSRRQSTIMRNQISIIYDAAENDKKHKDNKINSPKIRKRIYDKLAAKGKTIDDGFDMEPFEVLCEIIKNKEDWAIGGSPQVVKIYKHMNAMPYALFWPTRESNNITFLGRPLLDYEHLPYLILDPVTLKTIKPKIANHDLAIKHDDGTFEKSRSITFPKKK
jgi:hypothetical protein